MKRLILSAVIYWGVFGLVNAAAEVEGEVEGKVAQIRKWYAQIQEDKTLKESFYRAGEDDPSEVAMTRFTTPEGKVRKINIVSGGDHSAEEVTYYFWEGRLFFVYNVHGSWRFSGKKKADGQSGTIDSAGQIRYYFSGGKCIRALRKLVQSEDSEKIPALLKKAKNEPMVFHDTAPDIQKKARALLQVKSDADLEMHLSKP